MKKFIARFGEEIEPEEDIRPAHPGFPGYIKGRTGVYYIEGFESHNEMERELEECKGAQEFMLIRYTPTDEIANRTVFHGFATEAYPDWCMEGQSIDVVWEVDPPEWVASGNVPPEKQTGTHRICSDPRCQGMGIQIEVLTMTHMSNMPMFEILGNTADSILKRNVRTILSGIEDRAELYVIYVKMHTLMEMWIKQGDSPDAYPRTDLDAAIHMPIQSLRNLIAEETDYLDTESIMDLFNL